MKWLQNSVLLAVVTAFVKITAAANSVYVSDVEELYAAVNDASNAGAQVVIAPGHYQLTVSDPSGSARPNRGRLELQEDMSLIGSFGRRSSVIIDAALLPQSSYQGSGIPLTGAIRIGKGSNAIKWLTVKNASVGSAAIEADLVSPGIGQIVIAHIASTGNIRGLDIRNFGPAASGRTLEVDIIDSEFYNNTFGLAEGFRVGNFAGATGSTINVRMTANRSYGNEQGRLIVNNAGINCTINALSIGNHFYGNGAGTNLIAGLGGGQPANANTVNYESFADRYEDNTLPAQFDRGGLNIIGGENIIAPDRANNNTVRAKIWVNRFSNNSPTDLYVVGARSFPASAGIPGSGNEVTVELKGIARRRLNYVLTDGLPNDVKETNTATINW